MRIVNLTPMTPALGRIRSSVNLAARVESTIRPWGALAGSQQLTRTAYRAPEGEALSASIAAAFASGARTTAIESPVVETLLGKQELLATTDFGSDRRPRLQVWSSPGTRFNPASLKPLLEAKGPGDEVVVTIERPDGIAHVAFRQPDVGLMTNTQRLPIEAWVQKLVWAQKEVGTRVTSDATLVIAGQRTAVDVVITASSEKTRLATEPVGDWGIPPKERV